MESACWILFATNCVKGDDIAEIMQSLILALSNITWTCALLILIKAQRTEKLSRYYIVLQASRDSWADSYASFLWEDIAKIRAYACELHGESCTEFLCLLYSMVTFCIPNWKNVPFIRQYLQRIVKGLFDGALKFEYLIYKDSWARA